MDAISENIAKRLHLKIEILDSGIVQLPGRCIAENIGRTTAEFKFQGEGKGYRRVFHVLRNCVYDVVLSRRFLEMTRTLTDFRHRIVERVRPCLHKGSRLFLFDESPKDLLHCRVNGMKAAAYPDTGSELMLVSGEYCRRHCLHVHREKIYQRPVELINGSTIWTDGMVLDAELQFDAPPRYNEVDFDHFLACMADTSAMMASKRAAVDKATFICDLHVIDSLPVDIILSGEFIFQNDVFRRFENLFCPPTEPLGPVASVGLDDGLFFIRRKLGKTWQRWWDGWRDRRPQDETSDIPLQIAPTWQDKWEAEEDRRNRIQRWIGTLPEPQRSVERRNELSRQGRWDRENPRVSIMPPSNSFDPSLRRTD